MSKTIPDRWLEYKPFGTVLKGTKILPFKVPLKETARFVKPENRFTPSTLVQAFPRLKYVIDLTNTNRYYDKQELIDSGITYKKLWVLGHEVPSEEVVNQFFEFMNEFTSTSGEEDIIGVHCTHGINRTGYLICRYLVEQLGLDPEESIKAFAEARGYAIERQNYVTHLKRNSKNSLPVAQEEPPFTSTVKTTPFAGGSRNRLRTTPHERPSNSMRRCYVKDGCGAFPPQPSPPPPPFGFPGPRFRPMPPLRCPPMMFGGRPFRYGPPRHPPPPPRSGFPIPGFPPPPPRPSFPMPGFPPPPGPKRNAGGPRIPPGPPARLPPPNMPPPPPPPPPPSSQTTRPRPSVLKRMQTQQRKQHIRNGIAMLVENRANLIKRTAQYSRLIPKLHKEQDFTVDTYEENLLTGSGQQIRLRTRSNRTSDNSLIIRHTKRRMSLRVN